MCHSDRRLGRCRLPPDQDHQQLPPHPGARQRLRGRAHGLSRDRGSGGSPAGGSLHQERLVPDHRRGAVAGGGAVDLSAGPAPRRICARPSDRPLRPPAAAGRSIGSPVARACVQRDGQQPGGAGRPGAGGPARGRSGKPGQRRLPRPCVPRAPDAAHRGARLGADAASPSGCLPSRCVTRSR